MDVEPTVLAYLAGVIDSDGYITIHRSVRLERVYHAARVGISGTRPEPHRLAVSLWGGKVGCYRPRNLRHRPQFQWSRTGDDAVGIILAVLPYLRVKRTQALAALELQEHVIVGRSDDPHPWFGPEYDPVRDREEMRAEVVHVLNQDRRSAGIPVPVE